MRTIHCVFALTPEQLATALPWFSNGMHAMRTMHICCCCCKSAQFRVITWAAFFSVPALILNDMLSFLDGLHWIGVGQNRI